MKKIALLLALLLVGGLIVKVQKSYAAGPYDQYVYQYSAPQTTTGADDLKGKLEAEVNKIIAAGHLAPFRTIYGEGPAQYYWYHTYDTIYTLSLAYPYVTPATQAGIKTYLATEMKNYPIWYSNSSFWGYPFLSAEPGTKRDPDILPAGLRTSELNGWPLRNRPLLFGLYALWTYAQNTGDWSYINSNWSSITSYYNSHKVNSASGQNEINSSYSGLAGAIGMARMAHQKSPPDTTTENAVLSELATGFTNGKNITQFGTLGEASFKQALSGGGWDDWTRSDIFLGFLWQDLTPEVGRFLSLESDTNGAKLRDTVIDANGTSLYSLHRGEFWYPLWYVAQGETWSRYYGEGSAVPPDAKNWLFGLHAFVVKDSPAKLRKYLDVPDALVGDYYYLQNLSRTIEHSLQPCWVDIRDGSKTCDPQVAGAYTVIEPDVTQPVESSWWEQVINFISGN